MRRPSPNFGKDFALAPPAWVCHRCNIGLNHTRFQRIVANTCVYVCVYVCVCACVCMCKVTQLRRHAQVVDRSKSPGLKGRLVLQTFEVVFSWRLRILYENDRPQVRLQGKLCCRSRQSITEGLTKRKDCFFVAKFLHLSDTVIQ